MNLKLLFSFLLISSLSLIMASCTKTKEQKIAEFVEGFNSGASKMNVANVVSVKAEPAQNNEILIRIKTDLEKEEIGAQLLQKSAGEMLSKVIASDSKNNLFTEGIPVKLTITGIRNILITTEYLKKPEKGLLKTGTDKNEQLSELIADFNKNLPITDPETGISTTKIEVVNRTYLQYSAVVPDDIIESFKSPEANKILKEELDVDPNIQNILRKYKDFKIESISYIYMDSKGNVLQKVSATSKEFQNEYK